MSKPIEYSKRLIEVDLPIKKISEHSRREKSIRHGHISTLHIWWARRPLAACRAVLCATLWPDPADPLCPEEFKQKAAGIMKKFWDPIDVGNKNFEDSTELRKALLDFIADFADWYNSTKEEYLETSRALTNAAHVSNGGIPDTYPLVLDSFAGGGSIPLEALRVGADAFASDLNPIPVLLNRIILEYVPKYGQRLADEVNNCSIVIKQEAEKELSKFYPKASDGGIPIAYLWARTITCEGPSCGAEVPLIRSLWLVKKKGRSIALKMIPKLEDRQVVFDIIENAKEDDVSDGTVNRGKATCKCCGYTTPVDSVRKQLRERRGGTQSARLFCVVTTKVGQKGRFYQLPTEQDFQAIRRAGDNLEKLKREHKGPFSLVPDELLPPQGTLGFRIQLYGMEKWGDLFNTRQALAVSTLSKLTKEAHKRLAAEYDEGFAIAVLTCLALGVSKQADFNSSLSRWANHMEKSVATFGRHALPMLWDWGEVCPVGESTGSYKVAMEWIVKALRKTANGIIKEGNTTLASATNHPLPDDSVNVFATDPPYYDAIPYSNLSDYFYVWLKRTIGNKQLDIFSSDLSPKDDECVVDRSKGHDKAYFEKLMEKSMSEGRRILAPNGVGIVVFAHKSTGGWEAQLQAMINAGWIITASWPIDTEKPDRMRALNSAALASSIHLICRPRENLDGSMRNDDIGDWRDVLEELPKCIHEWMPRLAKEGVVGADAIFSCLGPALEIYSRYSSVEKASGEVVTLNEYLEHVWATVSKEALNMIFTGADATGFEEDARLTAMWLWTLSAGVNGGSKKDDDSEKSTQTSSFVLEYDAVRKIAQGLGAHLDKLKNLVEIKGDKVRLLPVEERSNYLFGKDVAKASSRKKHEKAKQTTLLGELTEAEDDSEVWGEMKAAAGNTTLDRIHQAMLLFAAGRGEALKRFLVEEGIGSDTRFWRLAQSLSALYPTGTNERRWVEGILARKKGLGF